jgi:ceramide glucosyltransferase
MLAFPARSLAHGRSYGALVARYARWLTVVRLQRPWLLPSYPLLLASLPMVAALALVALATGAPTRAVALAVASPLVARWALAFALGAKLGRGGSLARRWLEPFLADALLTVAWLRAVTRSDVQWRGRALRAEGGKLVAAEARPAD